MGCATDKPRKMWETLRELALETGLGGLYDVVWSYSVWEPRN